MLFRSENVRRSLSDWLRFMHLVPAGVPAELDRYIGYWEPYATSHEALDRDETRMCGGRTQFVPAVRPLFS